MKPISLTDNDYQQLYSMVQEQHQAPRPCEVDALGKELKRATIFPSMEIPPDVITMNSIVQIRESPSTAALKMRIVYPHEANLQQQKVSVLAPLGTAIIGCRVGDEVRWKLMNETHCYKVEKILYQPEAAGDLHL
ncbi:MAG: nucleoside diphosphate kinase regulator [Adhaeribacter sp.]